MSEPSLLFSIKKAKFTMDLKKIDCLITSYNEKVIFVY